MTDFCAVVDGLRAYADSPAGKAESARIREEGRLARRREAAALFCATVPEAYRGRGAVERCDARLMPALAWLGSTSRTLLLSGATGTGKSTMAAELVRRCLAQACITEQAWDAGRSIAWAQADALEQGMDRFGETAARVRNVKLLVVDELALGGERTRGVVWHRFERLRLRTVITVDMRTSRLITKFDAAFVRRLTEDRGEPAEIVEAW